MTPTDLATLTSTLTSGVEALVLLIGGAWAYLRFVWARDRHPRVTMHTEFTVLGPQGQGMDEQVLGVVKVTVKNHGGVRLRFRRATVTVLRLALTDTLKDGGVMLLGQPVFRDDVGVNDRRLFPASWVYSFVDAGGENTYRSVVRLPTDTSYVLAQVRFQYEDDAESDFHADSVVVRVS